MMLDKVEANDFSEVTSLQERIGDLEEELKSAEWEITQLESRLELRLETRVNLLHLSNFLML